MELKYKEKVTVPIEISPTDATNTHVSWLSLDENVARVKNGVVEAIGLGETEIYAISTDNSEIKCNIKVCVSYEGESMFTDVSLETWYFPFVLRIYDIGLMKGKGTTNDGKIIFDPGNNMTRAEFVQTLYNKEGKPSVTYQTTFTDVKNGQWYTNAIMWASQNGIIAGKGNEFDVSGNITRQEMATILYKYATNYKKYETAGRADVSAYTDVSTISSWATENMKWAVHYGIMKGQGDRLAPQANASRAECATMLKNFMDSYENK